MGVAQPDHDARVAAVRARLADIVDPQPDPEELDLVAHLLRSFAAKTPDSAALLVRLLREGDLTRVREHSHSMKGSASNIGADVLSALCAGVEDQARAGVLADPDAVERDLRGEVEVTLGAIRELSAEYERHLAA